MDGNGELIVWLEERRWYGRCRAGTSYWDSARQGSLTGNSERKVSVGPDEGEVIAKVMPWMEVELYRSRIVKALGTSCRIRLAVPIYPRKKSTSNTVVHGARTNSIRRFLRRTKQHHLVTSLASTRVAGLR